MTKQLMYLSGPTVEVGGLHTLRLKSLKLVFQPLHKFLVNKLQFWQVGYLLVHDKSFIQQLFTDRLFHLLFTVSQFQRVRSLHTLS